MTAPSKQARESHEALSPNHVSAVTDPELIEVFDKFAFREVLQQSNLDARWRKQPNYRHNGGEP